MADASQDHYKVLDVSRAASPSEIKAAYRRLSRELHPDAAPGVDTAQRSADFSNLALAFEVLSDPEKRRSWDAETRRSGRPGRSRGPANSSAGSGRSYPSGRKPNSNRRKRSDRLSEREQLRQQTLQRATQQRQSILKTAQLKRAAIRHQAGVEIQKIRHEASLKVQAMKHQARLEERPIGDDEHRTINTINATSNDLVTSINSRVVLDLQQVTDDEAVSLDEITQNLANQLQVIETQFKPNPDQGTPPRQDKTKKKARTR